MRQGLDDRPSATPEEEGVAYLRDEIEWHRRAGRLLFPFVIGSVGGSILVVREELASFNGLLSRQSVSPWEVLLLLLPILIPACLSIWGGIHFFRYYRRISRLKVATQEILGHWMTDDFVKKQWERAFGK